MIVLNIFKVVLLISVPLSTFCTENRGFFPSRYLPGHTFSRIYGLTYQQCKTKCLSRGKCDSVNFRQRKYLCELNFETEYAVSLDKLERRSQWYYGRKESWDDKHNSCPHCMSNQICNGSTTSEVIPSSPCITIECPQPNEPTNMYGYHGNVRTVGAMVTASCRIGSTALLSNSHQHAQLKCTSSGSWDVMSPYPNCNPEVSREVSREVFRCVSGKWAGIYRTWLDGRNTLNDSACLETHRPDTCDRHYRHDDVDQWESLNVSRVLFSIYKDNQRVHYILFDGHNTTKENWFAKDRVLNSSWIDLPAANGDLFSMKGVIVKGGEYGSNPSCHIRRRYLIGRTSGDCSTDSGWFMASFVHDFYNESCCWCDQGKTINLLYSKSNTFASFHDISLIEHADHVSIFIITKSSEGTVGSL